MVRPSNRFTRLFGTTAVKGQLLAALSFLMMLPVHLAPVDTGERLLAEAALAIVWAL